MPSDEFKRRYGDGGSVHKALDYADKITSPRWSGEVDLTGVKCNLPLEEDDDYLVVLSGLDGDGTPVVAFHAGQSLLEALGGAFKRMALGKLRWRVDAYAMKRLGGSE